MTTSDPAPTVSPTADQANPSTLMTLTERWEFLAEPRVAVISAHAETSLAVPIWIAVDGESVLLVTPPGSEKARVILAAGRAWVTVQTHDAPYRYVSGEGPAALAPEADLPAVVREMSIRYLGDDEGARFAGWWLNDAPDLVAIRITPRRWRSFDDSPGRSGG